MKADLAKASKDEEDEEEEEGDEYEEDEDEDQYEEEDEEEEDDGDFDANELLNLTDYQNKRKQAPAIAPNSGSASKVTVGKDGALEINNESGEDD